jgi:hypothetical protein
VRIPLVHESGIRAMRSTVSVRPLPLPVVASRVVVMPFGAPCDEEHSRLAVLFAQQHAGNRDHREPDTCS